MNGRSALYRYGIPFATSALLLLGPSVTRTHAFEGSEHLEIGNCGALVVYEMLGQLPLKYSLSSEEKESITRARTSLAWFLPRIVDENASPSGLGSCVIPEHSSDLGEWWNSLTTYATAELKPDARGRKLILLDPRGNMVGFGPAPDLISRLKQGEVLAPARDFGLISQPLGERGTLLLSPTYGHIVEMVDFYNNPHKILASGSVGMPNQQWPKGPKDLQPKGHLPWPEVMRAVTSNDSHFGELNLLSFRELHGIAKRIAAGDNDNRNFYGALLVNGLADHYLQDILAPGHVMAARQTIPEEIAVAMHDRANEIGVHFKLKETDNISSVLDFVETHFQALFGCDPTQGGAPCNSVRAGMKENRSWLKDRVRMRGDGHLTDKWISKRAKQLPNESARQYSLVLAIQVLSILDVLRESDPELVCGRMIQDCEALARGFSEDVLWTWPKARTMSAEESEALNRPGCEGAVAVDPPSATIAGGRYERVDVLSDLQRLAVAPGLNSQIDFSRRQKCWKNGEDKGEYKYLDYGPILGLKYQREYSRGSTDIAPKVLSLEWTPSVISESGEVLHDARKGLDKTLPGNTWITTTLALRLGLAGLDDGLNTYGVEGRGTLNFFAFPWRVSIFGRAGRARDSERNDRADNSVGIAFEPFRSTMFTFGVVYGWRFPVTEADRQYYGFEVGMALPMSRWPLIGSR
jgi:hypothetical protein